MADFTFDFHRCTPREAPKYNVLKTQMEGWKVKTRLKSTDPVRWWEIEIRGRTNTERDLIIAHWDGQFGQTTPFNWVRPASWDGITYYVTYESMNYTNPPGFFNVWDFVIIFKEEI